jgi:hypothetical protein
MRTGILSDESVRRFCKTIERDESTAPFTRRLLATRGNRQQFARRLAEATYSPEQLAVASPRMYAAMFQRAAHILTAPEGEVWEGYEEFVASEAAEEDEEDAFSDAESEGEQEFVEPGPALVQFEPLSVAGSSTDPLTPPTTSRRRSYTMQSSMRISTDPASLPIGTQSKFEDPRDKGDISRPRTRSFMKSLTRDQLIALYNQTFQEVYRTAPPPTFNLTNEEMAEDLNFFMV